MKYYVVKAQGRIIRRLYLDRISAEIQAEDLGGEVIELHERPPFLTRLEEMFLELWNE